MKRIYLSAPHMSGDELTYIKEAFDTNWIAPLGPNVNGFEAEMCAKLGAGYATALSSGTAALHLALVMLGIKPGDTVACSTLTFAASANAIKYTGGTPVFIDSDRTSWNMDPDLLAQYLEDADKAGKLPKAVIVVDLYGQCADYDPILEACAKYDIPLIEDAAESLGATYKGKPAGTFGDMAVLSFNGNKIITTSGGGMLLTPKKEFAEKALFLATQARDDAPHYQHSTIGYNYRMSNIIAGIGRGQLGVIDDRVASRRAVFEYYQKELGQVPGIVFMPEAPYGKSNRWLTCMTVDPAKCGATAEDIRLHLEKSNIESRPVWKPMHLQPVFADCKIVGGKVSEKLFELGLCLPSSSFLSKQELGRIVSLVKKKIEK